LSLALIEASPGSFDLVLGYLPGRSGARGSLVGNGRLQLVNLFGGGRTLGVKLNRLPGQTSTVNVAVDDPFLFSLPIGVSFGFDGEQRDSTYGKQRYEAGLSYRILEEIELSATVTREATRPGQAGITFRNGLQRISRADALLAGIGVGFQNLDDRINPRKGVSFESSFFRGSKETTQRRIVTADTLTTKRSFRQERLSASVRLFVPLAVRHVFAVGVDAGLLRSDEYELSDLLRLGGANSLRGYNEEQFVGRFVNRWLVEYRYLLERRSYAYVFLDVGVVERPDVEEQPAETSVHPGYGFGMQFETGIGVVNATYALNRDDGPTNGKIHVGLSLAL
jgi:outer membrane protein assembly factor BamA